MIYFLSLDLIEFYIILLVDLLYSLYVFSQINLSSSKYKFFFIYIHWLKTQQNIAGEPPFYDDEKYEISAASMQGWLFIFKCVFKEDSDVPKLTIKYMVAHSIKG